MDGPLIMGRIHYVLLSAVALVLGGVMLQPLIAQGDGISAANRVTRERGELAAASITGTALGSANTILATTKQSAFVTIDTDCAVGFMITKDGADLKRLFPGKGIVLDLQNNGVALAAGTYKIYYTGSAPSSCTVEVVSFPYR